MDIWVRLVKKKNLQGRERWDFKVGLCKNTSDTFTGKLQAEE